MTSALIAYILEERKTIKFNITAEMEFLGLFMYIAVFTLKLQLHKISIYRNNTQLPELTNTSKPQRYNKRNRKSEDFDSSPNPINASHSRRIITY